MLVGMKEKVVEVGSTLIAWRFPIITSLIAVAVFATVATVLSVPSAPVLVANSRIAAGEVIDETNTTITQKYPDFASDAATNLSEVKGKRSQVDIEPDTVIRNAYVRDVNVKGKRDVLALPVSGDVARLFTKGDAIDIYAPADCPPDGPQCPAQILAQNALVEDVISTVDDSWSTSQNATLVVGVKPEDTTLVAGVVDSAALKLVRVSDRTAGNTTEESKGAAQ